jgi:NAD(P)-dependent dehydrogenase (short-subunit alcohol dehydrogenase family)
MHDFSGKRVLITGASRGIGAAIASAFIGSSANVINIDRDSASNLTTFTADLSDADATTRAFQQAADAQGVPDILVNNAGISERIPAEEYPLENFRKVAAINVWAPFHLMQLCARHWIGTKQPGCVVNIASVYGLVADPLSAPYSASKGALVQLTRTCAVEWAPHGIRVNAVAPGYTRTEMTAKTLDSPAGKHILTKVPMGRAALPEEIAGAVLFLSSPAAAFITGHILTVDGGYTAQ